MTGDRPRPGSWTDVESLVTGMNGLLISVTGRVARRLRVVWPLLAGVTLTLASVVLSTALPARYCRPTAATSDDGICTPFAPTYMIVYGLLFAGFWCLYLGVKRFASPR